MRFSLPLYPYDRWQGVDAIGAAVVRADELGFAAVALPEHVVMPRRDGASAPSTVWYDNFVLAGMLAGLTSRIRFQLHAMVVPYRHPVVAAKLLSTLDTVSGGRVTVVAAAGWVRREFELVGVDYDRRGALTDEYLAAMKVLWTEDDPVFHGPTVDLTDLDFRPRCVQAPHVPLWIGGGGRRPLRRAAAVGDGWAPLGDDVAALEAGIGWLRRELAERGRDEASFTFSADLPILGEDLGAKRPTGLTHGRRSTVEATSSADQVVDLLRRYDAMGLAQVNLIFPWTSPAEYVDRMEWLAAEVAPHVAG